MGDWLFKIGAAALLAVGGLWSSSAQSLENNSCVDVHFARGTSSASIQGNSQPDVVDCFTFRAGEGQTAHLKVNGRNMVISVIGLGDARNEWTFKTKSQPYKFIVGQLMRSVTNEPYTISLTIEAAARCGPDHLDLCRNTNQLMGSIRFQEAVLKLVGDRRAAFLYEGSVADQALDVLGGPPDDVERIGDLYRFTACRAHSCQEKGAAALDATGHLIAVGILHSACAKHAAPSDCFAHETLTLFVREPERWQNVIANLSEWARSEISQSYTGQGILPERLDAVKVETVK